MNEVRSVSSVQFDLKCLCCGHREKREIPPGLAEGPCCTRCYGPVVVGAVEARRKQRAKR